MVEIKPKEIIQAEELLKTGKTEEALKIIRDFQQSAWPYFFKGNYDKSLEIGLQSKELIEKIGEEIDYANNFLLLGWSYSLKGNIEHSLKYGMKCIELFQKLNIRVSLASSYFLVGNNYSISNDFELSYKYLNQALSIKEIIPLERAAILNLLASIYLMKGNFSQMLRCSEEGLKFAEKEKLLGSKAQFLSTLGIIYAFMNDFDKAKEYYKKALEGAEKLKITYLKGYMLFQLIMVNVEENSMNQANKYLERFREYVDQKKGGLISNIYFLSRGIVLYQSSRARDRAEAESLFKQIVDAGLSPGINLYVYSYALYGLITIYIEELRISNDLKIIEEINPLISILFSKAEQFDSILFLTLGKIFQAKVEIILLDFDNAKRLLTEAQQLAEINNNQFYAQIISNEHDRLLEFQDIKDNLKKLKTPKAKRIKLASFRGITNITLSEEAEDSSEFKPEKPVFLLIITESGAPLFSYSFSQELSFEDDIISSFISAFNTFSGELFSKGLDRARFGDYIILRESVESFSVCYIFKGQSYPAKQKLTSLIEELQNNSTIWQTLDKFSKTSQVAELKDIPVLESLMSKIFSGKTYIK